MQTPLTDHDWMAACARLSARARPLSRPNPGVAALLVSEGRVVSRGWTRPGGRPHAEAIALEGIEPGEAAGAVLYVTLEPCAHQSPRGPSCCDLVAAARPSRVVIGQRDPDPRTSGRGIAHIERAGIGVTVLDDEASRNSLSGYLARQLLDRPQVTLKLAMSLDGCIALVDGSSRWITGEQARAHVHAQRARHDAILVGGGTWRADQPGLDVRVPGLADRSPQRVLLTRGVAPDGVRVINWPEQISQLEETLHLYVEGGALAAASFLERDLVDQLHIYRAPILIGGGQPALAGIGLDDLAAAHGRWRLAEQRQLGSDVFESYERTR